jgi:hypothetical protein
LLGIVDDVNWFILMWFSAKPQGFDVLLHEEKLIKLSTQIIVNMIFFIIIFKTL